MGGGESLTNLTAGNLSGTVTVGHGGTGLSSAPAGSFLRGNGSGWAAATVASGDLPADVAYLDLDQTISGAITFKPPLAGAAPCGVDANASGMVGNLNAQYVGGRDAAYLGNAANLTGLLSDQRLSTNVCKYDAASPTFANGLLYAAGGRTPAGDHPGSVVAFDPGRGTAVWTHFTPGYVIADAVRLSQVG